MARVVIRRSGHGKQLQSAIEANSEALAFYKTAPRSRLIRHAMEVGGNNYRALFFKERPTQKLWTAPFNYKLKKSKRRFSGADVKPLIGRHRGQNKLIRAMYRGKVKSTKSGGSFMLRIGIPFGHHVDKEIQRVMSIVPRHEAEWLIDDIANGIAKGIEKGKVQEKKRIQKAKDQRNRRARERYRERQRAAGKTTKARRRRR